MLLTKDLLEGIGEEYIDMLKSVNIPDFTKCISIFSGLNINKIDDGMIKNYLQTWAKNKYRFYKMLGNRTKVDMKIQYNKIRDNIREEVSELGKEFPAYYLWLDAFSRQTSNKINEYELKSDYRYQIREFVGRQYKLEGSSMTHFFKSMLNAPDELVTKIASIFENDKVEANYTISIDPVDIMTASENPYDWQSCYRLETENRDSHADGCMASLLDDKCLITYVWKNEGKLDLYHKYELKSVRYKMMREWIAISNSFTTVHFNSIYPGKDYPEEFEKILRDKVETLISNYKEIPNKWRRSKNVDCYRANSYGYTEFDEYNMYTQCDSEDEDIEVFGTEYKCACGCGVYIPGSYPEGDCYKDEELEYDGIGFRHDCMEEKFWCEYSEDYCSSGCCTESSCKGCSYWDENHPVCDLCNEDCPNVPDEYWEYDRNGIVESRESHCKGCPYWESCASGEDCEE